MPAKRERQITLTTPLDNNVVNSLRITNILLLIIAIPVIVIVLKTLKFIFVPLLFAMFISLLFVPFLRAMRRRGVHKVLSALAAISMIAIAGFVLFMVMKLSSQEILSTKDVFFERAEGKLVEVEALFESSFGVPIFSETNGDDGERRDLILQNAKSVSAFVIGTAPQLLTTLFFIVLLLFESYDFENLLNKLLLKQRFTSIKTFKRIEKDLVKFIYVKFLISAGTGIGTGLVCYAFDVSFPIFWGLFAFAINFVQMVGSIISILLCSIFAFVELETGTTLLYFVIAVSGVQVIFGSILEPIFMGKSFSINVIVVLVMLMFWGYVWGVPGMILSIPLTVSAKIIFEQFERTRRIAKLMQ